MLRPLLVLTTLASAALVACQSAQEVAPTPTASMKKQRKNSARPLSRALSAVVVKGRLEVRGAEGGRWQPLAQGETISNLVAIKFRGVGAMLDLGGAAAGIEAGRIWLGDGAELACGQSRDGRVQLRVIKGDVRISLYDPSTHATLRLEGQPPRTIDNQDILVYRASIVRHTAIDPKAADWTLAMLEATPPPRAGIGSLTSRTSSSNNASLELRRVRVQATTSGDMAETRVEHVFFNDSDARLEGTFRFPLPEGAALLGLAMDINGKLMEGELVERQKARKTYESIVDSMQDPALLEWEQGNIFKLRVFPIEPRSEKRVILRYVAPLEKAAKRLSYVYPTAAPEMKTRIPRFALELDGKSIVDTKNYAPGRDVVAYVNDALVDRALQERRKDGTYTALRLRPDWSRIAPKLDRPRRARDLLLMVDTSRSGLESRKLALQSVRTLLSGLRRGDRFLLVAADLEARAHAAAFVPASKVNIERALAFISALDFDGATDMGRALRAAGAKLRAAKLEGRHAQVVYLGDGTPTWGETAEKKLLAIAGESLGETPLHAIMIGKGANTDWLRRLAAHLGGRAIAPRAPRDVMRLALALATNDGLPRLHRVRIRAGEKDQIFPRVAPTLHFGQELVVLIRSDTKAGPPKQVVLEGQVGGEAYAQTFLASRVAPARHVAHRWARHQLAELDADKAPRAKIVEHSLRYGVMSRHTAFLVLESEEAYKRFDIARKKKEESSELKAPKITGGDLESINGARASLSPERFQPGDPEVRVPAPRDARSVVVVFPFGETKVARYEEALKAWTVRFLVPQSTPDGRYEIKVRITHADGGVEMLTLSYVIDTQAPTIKVRLRKRGRGYAITARQIVTAHELLRAAPRSTSGAAKMIAEGASPRRYATIVEDAARVEVRIGDGDVKRLWPYGKGRFGAIWRPSRPLTAPLTLTFVAVDSANNKRVFAMVFDPASGTLTPQPKTAVSK